MKIIQFLFRLFLAIFVLLNVVAAIHAYKFTHFYSETSGTAIRPENLDAFDKLKVIFLGINFPKSKNDALPDSPYKTIYLKTPDHIRLEAWYMPSGQSRGTVLMFHGHGSSKSKLLHEADYMHSIGFNILLVDFRAHGGSDGNVCTIGYKEAADVETAFRFIGEKGEKNIVLWGISLGSATILKAVHDYPEMRPSKLILEMPFGTLVNAVQARMRTMNLPQEPFAHLLTFWGGMEHGFWAFSMQPAQYARDVHCPVLVQWGALDRRVSSKEIQDVYNNIPIAEKKLVIYETAAHESLYGREHEKWRQEIARFLLVQ